VVVVMAVMLTTIPEHQALQTLAEAVAAVQALAIVALEALALLLLEP